MEECEIRRHLCCSCPRIKRFPLVLGYSTCWTCVTGRDSQNAWFTSTGRHTLCHRRALRYVRIGVTTSRHWKSVLWRREWEIWRMRKCTGCERYVGTLPESNLSPAVFANNCYCRPRIKSSLSYEALGGYYRTEAIMLLRKFYLIQNSNGTSRILVRLRCWPNSACSFRSS